MTTPSTLAMHLSVAVLAWLGFLALAFATERHGAHLLGRVPGPTWQKMARIAGWILLGIALAICIDTQGAGVGIVLWLGWLCVAALSLVFILPKWPWQPPVRAKPLRPPRHDHSLPPLPQARRYLAAALFVGTGAIFFIALWHAAQ